MSRGRVMVVDDEPLVLNLLRWGGEIRSWETLQLPPQGAQAAGIKDGEMAMAKQLIDEMSASWSADQFRDSFQAEVMKLVESKALAGHVEQVEKIDGSSALTPASANVVDLTELLQRSLGKKEAPPAALRKAPTARKAGKSTVRSANRMLDVKVRGTEPSRPMAKDTP